MKLRIIVLDIDESNRNLLSIIARNKGHEVLAFSEPEFCPLYSDLELCCSQDYACGDLMIIDNRMLKMTGLELIKKQIEGGCKLAAQNKIVISIFTSTEKEELQLAKELGCKIIKKPFKVKELSNLIEECEKDIDPNRKLVVLS